MLHTCFAASARAVEFVAAIENWLDSGVDVSTVVVVPWPNNHAPNVMRFWNVVASVYRGEPDV
jgi:hypothetical protein